MKVFNGNKFLDAHQVTLELSNGFKAVVREIPTEVMDALSKQGEETGDAMSSSLKELMGKICNAPAESFDAIGIVEMRGAIDFLLENLFGTKSQK